MNIIYTFCLLQHVSADFYGHRQVVLPIYSFYEFILLPDEDYISHLKHAVVIVMNI